MLRYLVGKGMELNVTLPNGYTVLHSAAAMEDVVLAEYLIEQGLDPECKRDKGETPLEVATARIDNNSACQRIIDLLQARVNLQGSEENQDL